MIKSSPSYRKNTLFQDYALDKSHSVTCLKVSRATSMYADRHGGRLQQVICFHPCSRPIMPGKLTASEPFKNSLDASFKPPLPGSLTGNLVFNCSAAKAYCVASSPGRCSISISS